MVNWQTSKYTFKCHHKPGMTPRTCIQLGKESGELQQCYDTTTIWVGTKWQRLQTNTSQHAITYCHHGQSWTITKALVGVWSSSPSTTITDNQLTSHSFYSASAQLAMVSIACYAECCISYSKSVCLSVCLSVRPSHAGTESKQRKLRSSLEDSPMILVSSTLDFTAKFQKEHGERGRRMREG